jgi:YfiR/HmsC-like
MTCTDSIACASLSDQNSRGMCSRLSHSVNRIGTAASSAGVTSTRQLPNKAMRVWRLVLAMVAMHSSAVESASAPMNDTEWIIAIARFVEWPNIEQRELIVCSPPRAETLMLSDKMVRGLRVIQRRIKTPEDAKYCHVLALFSEQRPTRWIRAASGLPVLTIGRGRDFCVYGGVVCVVPDADGIQTRHRINLDMMARAKLYARNELLTPQLTQDRSSTIR